MFKKNLLKSAALMGVSVLASVCANATDPKGLMEVEKTQTFTRIIEDGDPMSDETQPSTITTLPSEITDHIFSFLSLQEQAKAQQVCTSWHDVLVSAHGAMPIVSTYFFEGSLAPKAQKISDPLMADFLTCRIAKRGFAPLENVYISPALYPQDTRLLSAADLEAHPDIVSTWHTALFASTPQDTHALALVMAALPRILVEEHTSHETLEGITSYVRKVGKRTHFTCFTGDGTQEAIAALQETPHTLVVRAHDLHANKDALAALLDTHDDHHMILAVDDGTFLQDGVLNMLREDIPENLRHLILADPYGNVTAIENKFLSHCKGLTSFEARDFKNLTSIRNNFMLNCPELVSFDARGFSKVISIGNSFMANCARLPSFDARGLSSLTSIEGVFMGGCTGLTFFDAQGLTRLSSIGNYFLGGCTGLTSFDPTPLKGITTVGVNFLSETGISRPTRQRIAGLLTSVGQANAAQERLRMRSALLPNRPHKNS